MKKKGVKKKKVNKKPIKNKNSKKKNPINLILIIIGAIIIAVIIYFIFTNINTSEEKNIEQEEKPEANIKADFEWREPRTITPYGGRFYNKCEDGTNIGKIWANIELQTQETDLSFTCKTTIVVQDTQKVVDSSQLNLGIDKTKSGFIGFTEELAKEHLVEICCKSKEKTFSFCKTFELSSYC